MCDSPEFDARQAVFVGDRLDSDIAFANANGMASVLVETGTRFTIPITVLYLVV